MSQKCILVIGGAASGKSSFAENIIRNSNLDPVYIATARIWDAEMKSKVAQHVTARGKGWRTVEAPLEPAEALATCGPDCAVLLDCATMWLTNHMMDETDLSSAEARLRAALSASPALRVIVTNEVGQGIVPADPLSRRFRQLQGELNQRLAADADVVVQMIAGLPNVLKGVL